MTNLRILHRIVLLNMEILNLVKGPLVVIKLVEKPLVFILQVIITPFATVISKIYVQLLQFK